MGTNRDTCGGRLRGPMARQNACNVHASAPSGGWGGRQQRVHCPGLKPRGAARLRHVPRLRPPGGSAVRPPADPPSHPRSAPRSRGLGVRIAGRLGAHQALHSLARRQPGPGRERRSQTRNPAGGGSQRHGHDAGDCGGGWATSGAAASGCLRAAALGWRARPTTLQSFRKRWQSGAARWVWAIS